MNWFKKAQNVWELSEEEYAGPWRDEFAEDEEAWSSWRKKRKEWTDAVQKALSRGEISLDELEERGVARKLESSKLLPLPSPLYHVTTAKDKVLKEGLKTRSELQQSYGKGLGGGSSDAISFTDDLETAKAIKNALLEAINVSRGNITIQDMIEASKKGLGASRPYYESFMSYLKSSIGEENLKYLLRGYIRNVSYGWPMTKEDFNQKNKGEWQGLERWPYGDQELYISFIKKATPEELTDKRFDIYKAFSSFREDAGGPMYPLFFSSDPIALAQVPEDQITIIKVEPKEGALGYQVSALGEWRTWAGDAVDIVGVL